MRPGIGGEDKLTFEPFVAKLLFDVVSATAVDVISKRTLDPKIRMAGRIWRAYSLVDVAFDVYGAWRIAAYSDVAGILASEIFVERLSKESSDAIPRLDGINFALQQKAEALLLKPDFTVQIAHDPEVLQPYQIAKFRAFIDQEINTEGGSLAEMTAPCVERAVRADEAVQELLQHPECLQQRPSQRWERRKNWLDRVNTGLGYALWRPIPAIGLGARTISNKTSYNGIFRRNTAEGYGRLTWTNGDVYCGQVRKGTERGYGVKRFADGRMFFGYFNDFYLGLGVSISSQRDRAHYGAHREGRLTGYGRQIGLRAGVESLTGCWESGVLLGSAFTSKADTLQGIAREFLPNPMLAHAAAKYQAEAAASHAISEANDSSILIAIAKFM